MESIIFIHVAGVYDILETPLNNTCCCLLPEMLRTEATYIHSNAPRCILDVCWEVSVHGVYAALHLSKVNFFLRIAASSWSCLKIKAALVLWRLSLITKIDGGTLEAVKTEPEREWRTSRLYSAAWSWLFLEWCCNILYWCIFHLHWIFEMYCLYNTTLE